MQNCIKLLMRIILCIPYLITVSVQCDDDFREYENAPEHVQEFYRLNHCYQTLDFVLKKKQQYEPLAQKKMSVWKAFEVLETLVDQSDPDLDLPQVYHAVQTAEALRRDGHPRWLILVGFLHDLGKMLVAYGEQQWAVVGDTFPVGCAFDTRIIYHSFFKNNSDYAVVKYQTQYGIYTPHCGFRNVHMSWGHDEYLYYVMKPYLPEEALYIIRFHSFYAAHKEGAYEYLMDEYDRTMMPWLKLFRNYDLYSKSSEKLNVEFLRPYYKELVQEFLPDEIAW